PVHGDLAEPAALGQVGEVQDVLLEARAAEADPGTQELRADAGVHADGRGHLDDVSTGPLAEGRQAVDGADALREEGIRGELGELTRPHVGRDDPLARYPVSIDVDELLDRPATGGSVTAPDENAIRFREVAYGTALGEELRVREDLEAGSRPGIEDALH